MKRRKFLASTMIGSSLPFSAFAGKGPTHGDASEKEIYELRTYDIKFGSNANILKQYLQNIYIPALKGRGVNHCKLFAEYSKEEPAKWWLLVSYPDTKTYIDCQAMLSDADFVEAASAYNAIPSSSPVYERYESSLLIAFDGMPQMLSIGDTSSLFELRIYEGYSEDAVRRKISMFNIEEIALFLEIGLTPVFFGEMTSGPYRPCLVYMLQFRDMEERDQKWGVFGQHPDWNKMRVKEEYANTVSKIRKIFLTPL